MPPDGEDDARRRHAQHGAMKRESAVPDGERVEGVSRVVGAVVDQHVDDARAEKHADDEIAHQGIDHRLVERHHSTANAPLGDGDADGVADDVHDGVPPQRERPDTDEFRRNAWIGDRHGRLARISAGFPPTIFP